MDENTYMTIFTVWFLLGMVANIFMGIYRTTPKEHKKERKAAERGWKVCMWIGIAVLSVVLLIVLGWVWYYICCGFLVFEESSLAWKIAYGLMTLIPIASIIGLIAIFRGWDPNK